MKNPAEKKQQFYDEGLKYGKSLMAGTLASTQQTGPGGQIFLTRASQTADFLGIPASEFITRIERFHQERIDAEPDLSVYPELKGYRDLLLARYRGMADGGMSGTLIALCKSMPFWVTYRMHREYGKIYMPPVTLPPRERCRIVYLPESDQGPLHFKNVDDPLKTWKPQPPIQGNPPWPYSPLFFDGTGSGLHIDEEPPEIFPADARKLCEENCRTVPDVKEFMVRYNYFWGSCNLLVHDEHGNSVAFDKASRCRIAVRDPESSGLNYINGMSSFDDTYEAFIRNQRNLYLKETGQSADSVETCYFRFCEGVLRNMKRRMGDLRANPTLEALLEMMNSRDPDGPLCKSGKPCHPDDGQPGATLIQRLFLLDRKTLRQRQWRGTIPVWEDPWETVVYS